MKWVCYTIIVERQINKILKEVLEMKKTKYTVKELIEKLKEFDEDARIEIFETFDFGHWKRIICDILPKTEES